MEERATHESVIAASTGFFQKLKKANAESALYATDQKLKTNAALLKAENDKLAALEEKKARLESFTDQDFLADAKKIVPSEEKLFTGDRRHSGGLSYGISVSQYMEAYRKATQPKHNPADDWIVIPHIDVTGI